MENITVTQFWAGILAVLIPNIYLAYNAYLNYRANLPVTEATAKATEGKSETDAQDRLFTEYDRQITNLRRVEDENRELRPLALKNAILERDILSCKEDKNDWKQYAIRLAKQLEENNIVPLPFRRTPTDGDTQEKIPTIHYPPIETDPGKLQTIEPIKEEK